jgi:hypothetical protein
VIFISFFLTKSGTSKLEIVLIGIVAMMVSMAVDYIFELYRKLDEVNIKDKQVNQNDQNDQNDQKEKVTCQKPDSEEKSAPIPYEPLLFTPISGIKSRPMNWKISGPLNQNTDEYKLYPGYYSSIIIRPGYHEGITPSNQINIDKLANKTWETSNPLDKFKYVKPMTGGSDAGIVRLADVVYSGDLIDILSGTNIIQRSATNSQVILDRHLPDINTNLSKLRFENEIKTETSLPIRYRERIHIKHNAMIDNKNMSRFIKYGERLQSHQDGPTYEVFRIFKRSNLDSSDYVKYGDEFVIAVGDQPGNKIYLKVEADLSISSEGNINDAVAFIAKLNRVSDPNNLCVYPGETIYP